MRFLLRPGWIALTLAVAAFAFACYYLLAPWQFHRSDERDGANAALIRAIDEPAVPRGELVSRGAAPDEGDEWRRVVVTGTYLPGDVLIRLRSVDGSAATEVVTALRADDGETVLVDRGYVRPAENGRLPAIAAPPPGPVTVTGYLRLDEPPPRRPMVDDEGYRQVYAAENGAVSAALGRPASPGYVSLVDGQPGVLTAVPLPPPDPNPSYSYAWQWLIFGLMAIGAWIHFARLEYRRAHATGRGERRSGDQADGGSGRRGAAPRRRVDPRDRPDGTPWDAEGSRPRG